MHNIRDRRPKEKADSKHFMEDMGRLIPDSPSDIDFKNTRWYQGHHQLFTMNLNCLQSEPQATLEDLPPSSSRSPQKRRSEEGNKSIFPHGICLFRDKKTTTSRVKMFKPTEIFTSWGHNKSGWKNIEQMARDLQDHGYSGLLRKVAGADLFAAEAHFHQSCHSKFYSKQVKHGRVIIGRIKGYIHNIQ